MLTEDYIQDVKKSEGFRSSPYLDSVGKPTIGYGSTFYENGVSVTMQDAAISMARADQLLRNVSQEFHNEISAYINVELTTNQWNALMSFVYNIGVPNFASSTILRKINNDPNDPSIADEFAKWIYGTIKGVKKIISGLITRRKRESEMYFKKKATVKCPHCLCSF